MQYSLSPPPVAKSSSGHAVCRSYFLSMPFRSAAKCLPLKFKWQGPDLQEFLFPSPVLCAPRLRPKSIQSINRVLLCFLFWGVDSRRVAFPAVSVSFPARCAQHQFHSAWLAWRQTALDCLASTRSALKLEDKKEFPLRCFLTFSLENRRIHTTCRSVLSLNFCWIHRCEQPW